MVRCLLMFIDLFIRSHALEQRRRSKCACVVSSTAGLQQLVAELSPRLTMMVTLPAPSHAHPAMLRRCGVQARCRASVGLRSGRSPLSAARTRSCVSVAGLESLPPPGTADLTLFSPSKARDAAPAAQRVQRALSAC